MIRVYGEGTTRISRAAQVESTIQDILGLQQLIQI